MTVSTEQAEALLQSAKQATQYAYAPYSHFPVGAALLCVDGTVISGVNVENVSFGLTLCAERSAMVQAISNGHRAFQAIAVWATQRPQGSITPCGACRQFLAEFLTPDCPVIFTHAETGAVQRLTIAALLPEAFGPGVDLAGNSPDRDNSTPGG